MPFQFPVGTLYFELDGIPYAQTDEGKGEHRVFTCAFEPPREVEKLQRMPHWHSISQEIFERLRAVFLAAQEKQTVIERVRLKPK